MVVILTLENVFVLAFEYRSLLKDYRSLSIDYRSLLIKYRALLIELTLENVCFATNAQH